MFYSIHLEMDYTPSMFIVILSIQWCMYVYSRGQNDIDAESVGLCSFNKILIFKTCCTTCS